MGDQHPARPLLMARNEIKLCSYRIPHLQPCMEPDGGVCTLRQLAPCQPPREEQRAPGCSCFYPLQITAIRQGLSHVCGVFRSGRTQPFNTLTLKSAELASRLHVASISTSIPGLLRLQLHLQHIGFVLSQLPLSFHLPPPIQKPYPKS